MPALGRHKLSDEIEKVALAEWLREVLATPCFERHFAVALHGIGGQSNDGNCSIFVFFPKDSCHVQAGHAATQVDIHEDEVVLLDGGHIERGLCIRCKIDRPRSAKEKFDHLRRFRRILNQKNAGHGNASSKLTSTTVVTNGNRGQKRLHGQEKRWGTFSLSAASRMQSYEMISA